MLDNWTAELVREGRVGPHLHITRSVLEDICAELAIRLNKEKTVELAPGLQLAKVWLEESSLMADMQADGEFPDQFDLPVTIYRVKKKVRNGL